MNIVKVRNDKTPHNIMYSQADETVFSWISTMLPSPSSKPKAHPKKWSLFYRKATLKKPCFGKKKKNGGKKQAKKQFF